MRGKRLASVLAVVVLLCGSAPRAFGADAQGDMAIRTELATYSTDTDRILVYWENGGSAPLDFGDHWMLEQKNGESWRKSDKEAAFDDIGYTLEPGHSRKHVYFVNTFTDRLEPGEYRICATYSAGTGQNRVTYTAYAPFRVVDAAAYKGISELDKGDLGSEYRDITPHSLFQNTDTHLYRNDKTHHTVVVKQGARRTLGGVGGGGRGVVAAQYAQLDGGDYLLYTCSRGVGTAGHRSRIFVFDLTSGQDIYISDAFSGKELGIGARLDDTGVPIPDSFLVTQVGYDDGNEWLEGYLGVLQYADGGFTYAPLPESERGIG